MLEKMASAYAERAFSLLKTSFSKNQNSCREDFIQVSLMMQYNNRDV